MWDLNEHELTNTLPNSLYSIKIDQATQEILTCTHTLVAASNIVEKAKSLTLGQHTIQWASHELSVLLKQMCRYFLPFDVRSKTSIFPGI